MKLENLAQPPFETTLMGVVRAVADYYGHDMSDGMLYGGSGHAFLVNVHKALCPSSPYCWKYDGFLPLLRNLGVVMTDLGFFHTGSPGEDRAAVEAKIRAHLDGGDPCSLCNMDNQVITGYDDEVFFTARPWPKNPDYPPGTLTFGEWTEFGKECHVSFFAFGKLERADERTILRESLAYALDLNRNPKKYQFDDYGIGPRAWDNWAAAAEEHGASHGNWWNGTVWSECRSAASAYFEEISGHLDGGAADHAGKLSAEFREIADRVSKIADKELAAPEKVEIVGEIKEREAAAVDRIEKLLALLD